MRQQIQEQLQLLEKNKPYITKIYYSYEVIATQQLKNWLDDKAILDLNDECFQKAGSCTCWYEGNEKVPKHSDHSIYSKIFRNILELIRKNPQEILAAKLQVCPDAWKVERTTNSASNNYEKTSFDSYCENENYQKELLDPKNMKLKTYFQERYGNFSLTKYKNLWSLITDKAIIDGLKFNNFFGSYRYAQLSSEFLIIMLDRLCQLQPMPFERYYVGAFQAILGNLDKSKCDLTMLTRIINSALCKKIMETISNPIKAAVSHCVDESEYHKSATCRDCKSDFDQIGGVTNVRAFYDTCYPVNFGYYYRSKMWADFGYRNRLLDTQDNANNLHKDNLITIQLSNLKLNISKLNYGKNLYRNLFFYIYPTNEAYACIQSISSLVITIDELYEMILDTTQRNEELTKKTQQIQSFYILQDLYRKFKKLASEKQDNLISWAINILAHIGAKNFLSEIRKTNTKISWDLVQQHITMEDLQKNTADFPTEYPHLWELLLLYFENHTEIANDSEPAYALLFSHPEAITEKIWVRLLNFTKEVNGLTENIHYILNNASLLLSVLSQLEGNQLNYFTQNFDLIIKNNFSEKNVEFLKNWLDNCILKMSILNSTSALIKKMITSFIAFCFNENKFDSVMKALGFTKMLRVISILETNLQLRLLKLFKAEFTAKDASSAATQTAKEIIQRNGGLGWLQESGLLLDYRIFSNLTNVSEEKNKLDLNDPVAFSLLCEHQLIGSIEIAKIKTIIDTHPDMIDFLIKYNCVDGLLQKNSAVMRNLFDTHPKLMLGLSVSLLVLSYTNATSKFKQRFSNSKIADIYKQLLEKIAQDPTQTDFFAQNLELLQHIDIESILTMAKNDATIDAYLQKACSQKTSKASQFIEALAELDAGLDYLAKHPHILPYLQDDTLMQIYHKRPEIQHYLETNTEIATRMKSQLQIVKMARNHELNYIWLYAANHVPTQIQINNSQYEDFLLAGASILSTTLPQKPSTPASNYIDFTSTTFDTPIVFFVNTNTHTPLLLEYHHAQEPSAPPLDDGIPDQDNQDLQKKVDDNETIDSLRQDKQSLRKQVELLTNEVKKMQQQLNAQSTQLNTQNEKLDRVLELLLASQTNNLTFNQK